MSSQFSYELDERQIRILMQNAELELNDAVWQKFDELAKSESKQTIDIGSYVPKFNLSISRSIIVPIIFILLIGGLSAMLFSFVDFKKKETIENEVPLVANPENFKKSEDKATVITKPQTNKTQTIVTPKVVASGTTSIAASTSTLMNKSEVKKPEPEKATEIAVKVKEEQVAKVAESENIISPVKKKKKRKIVAEPIPTIKTVTNLNEGVSEPELDLK